MIRLAKTEKSTSSSQIYLTIQIDAKRASIRDIQKKGEVQSNIDKKLNSFAGDITCGRNTDSIEQEFREYLRYDLFKHYVDIVSINDFVYDLKITLKTFRENIGLAGYKTSYEYINYEGAD